MASSSGNFLIAVCAWEVTVIGTLLITVALFGTHTWGKDDVVGITKLVICGFVVVGVIAFLSRRLGKLGGAITGVLCGLLPSVLVLTWVFVAKPGFEASAGSAGLAYMLAAPSSFGGMLAGIIFSARKKASVTS